MPKIDKYWVFHEGQLAEALAARHEKRVAGGAWKEAADAEERVIREFLASDAAKRFLLGGRAG